MPQVSKTIKKMSSAEPKNDIDIDVDARYKATSIEDVELVYTLLRERCPDNQIDVEYNHNTKEYIMNISDEKYIEDPKVPLNLSVKVIYGDSVTGDTPILLRHPVTHQVSIKTIQDICQNNEYIEYPEFKMFDQTIRLEKQYAKTEHEVWSDQGWNPIKKVIKHKTNKKIYRILTHTGCVDVTEDHSLCRDTLEKVKPTEVQVGMKLLHSFPTEFTENIDTEVRFSKYFGKRDEVFITEEIHGTWKVIPEFTAYSASSLGFIKNNAKNKLCLTHSNNGYMYVHIRQPKSDKKIAVHRLIAQTFLPNLENKPTINHKNHIRDDNRVDNLEWFTMKEQNEHKKKGLCLSIRKAILQFDKNNNFLREYSSILEASHCCGNRTSIAQVCQGKQALYKDYIWRYKEYEVIVDETWKVIEVEGNTFRVSSKGRVKAKNGRVSYGSEDISGYFRCTSMDSRKFVHNLVAIAFVTNDDITNKTIVNHKDGIKKNNEFTNLEWITHSGNAVHAFELMKAENIHIYTLTEDEAECWGFFMECGKATETKHPSGVSSFRFEFVTENRDKLEHFKRTLETIEEITFVIVEFTSKAFKMYPTKRTRYLVEKYSSLFMTVNMVPHCILNASQSIKKSYLNGYGAFDNADHKFAVKGKIGAMCMYYLMRSIGFNMYLQITDHPKKQEMYWLNVIRNEARDCTVIKKIVEKRQVDTDEFVYDIETEFGRFHSGVGQLTIQNTDSIFVSLKFNRTDFELNRKDAFKTAIQCGDNLTNLIFKRSPVVLEFEKVYQSFILLTKKRYIGKKFEDTQDPMKMKSLTTSGIAITRRDYSYLVKKCYKEVIDSIMDGTSLEDSVEIFKKYIEKIENYQVDFEDLIVSSTLAKNYSCSTCKEKCEWSKIMCPKTGCKENNVVNRREFCPKCKTKFKCLHTFNLGPVNLAVSMLKRNEEINVNDRIQYLLVEKEGCSKKADLAEDPRYAKEHNLKFNRVCYLEQLAKPIMGFLRVVLQEEPDLLNDILTFVNEKLVEFGGKKLKVADYQIVDE